MVSWVPYTTAYEKQIAAIKSTACCIAILLRTKLLLNNYTLNLLEFAWFEGSKPLPAVSTLSSSCVEISEAFWIGSRGFSSPQSLALARHRGTHSVDAVASSVVARNRVLDEQIFGTFAGEAGAQLGQITFIGRLSAGVAGWPELAALATRATGAVSITFQAAGHSVTTFTVLTPAVTIFALIDDSVATFAIFCQLIRLVQETMSVATGDGHPLHELLFGAGAELVRLDPFLTDHRLTHDTPVPVLTTAIARQIWLVVFQSQIVANGMGQVGSKEVRFERVDVDVDSDGFAGANCPQSGNGRSSIIETLSPERNKLLHLAISRRKKGRGQSPFFCQTFVGAKFYFYSR